MSEIGLGVGVSIGVLGLLSLATVLFFKFCRKVDDDPALSSPSQQQQQQQPTIASAVIQKNALQGVSFAPPEHSGRLGNGEEYGHGALSVLSESADQYADVPRQSAVAGNIYKDVPVVAGDSPISAGYRPLPSQALRDGDGGYVDISKEPALASPQIRAVQAIGGGVVSGRQELSSSKSEAFALYGDVPSEAATLAALPRQPLQQQQNTAVARTRTGTVAPTFL